MDDRETEKIIFAVQDALDNVSINFSTKKIIWESGEELSIIDTAKKIEKNNNIGINKVIRQIIIWLEMDYTPEGQTQIDDDFEDKMDRLIDDFISNHPEYDIQRA